MDLTNYNPTSNKFIVYSNTYGNFTDRMNGIVSTFLLALVNNYNFRIYESNMSLHKIFESEIEWNSNDWYVGYYRRGRLNINDVARDNKFWFEESTIDNHFSNTDVLHIFSNENLIQYIFNNPSYESILYDMGLTIENAYAELFNTLFIFNKKYIKNYDYLIDRLYEDGSEPMSIHIRTKDITENGVDYFLDAIKKNSNNNTKLFISSDDDTIIEDVKQKLSGLKTLSLPYNYILNNDEENDDIDLVKFYYELQLQSSCLKHIISPWSTMSQIISFLSTDHPILIENETVKLKNKINGYRKGKLKELFEII